MEIIKLELEVHKMQLHEKCFQKYTKNMVSVVDQIYPLMYSIRGGRPVHTECFWPKKMIKSAEGSRRVVISHTQWQLPLKAHKVVLGSTSLMFHTDISVGIEF